MEELGIDPEEFMRFIQQTLNCCTESTEAELILAAKRIPLNSVTNVIDSLVSSHWHHSEVPPSFLQPVRTPTPNCWLPHMPPARSHTCRLQLIVLCDATHAVCICVDGRRTP